MAEPENHTLHLLRDIREAIAAVEAKVEGVDAKVDLRFNELRSKLENIRQAAFGESVHGRYAVAEVEERLDAIEKRISMLEETH
jgi:polyhydroxyalkanoate synthesis regulator phasin